MTENQNNLIIDQFKLLIDQIKLDIDFTSGKEQLTHSYRLGSIKKVLSILEKYPQKIISSKQFENVKGIGKKSLIRIDEILNTGKLSEIKITSDSKKYLKVISELEDVFGIGRKKAYELFMKYSIQSVHDLKIKAKEGLIQLPENILKGLEYVGKLEQNIPKSEIEKINDIMQNITVNISPKLFGITCGSFRRQKETSGDIDFLLFHTDLITKNDILKSTNYLKIFIQQLKKRNIIIESLTSDDVPTKYMGVCKLLNGDFCRIDIRLIQYESFYPAILYFTGSRELNKKMRALANSHGYLLNEYGLFNNSNDSKNFNNMIKFNSEKEIFEILGMEYITPNKR